MCISLLLVIMAQQLVKTCKVQRLVLQNSDVQLQSKGDVQLPPGHWTGSSLCLNSIIRNP